MSVYSKYEKSEIAARRIAPAGMARPQAYSPLNVLYEPQRKPPDQERPNRSSRPVPAMVRLGISLKHTLLDAPAGGAIAFKKVLLV
jgi:hypothetical protein